MNGYASGSLDLFLLCLIKPVLLTQVCEDPTPTPTSGWLETLHCLLKDGEEAGVALVVVLGFS